jgi:transketolase
MVDCRNAYSQKLEEMALADERIVAVVNDCVGSARAERLSRSKFPQRFINVGIAEQNMVGVSAGLANGGMIPYVCGAACFMTARAMEQIKVDLGYSNYNVKLVGISSGMAYGELGPTHHSIEDVGWMRIIPKHDDQLCRRTRSKPEALMRVQRDP